MDCVVQSILKGEEINMAAKKSASKPYAIVHFFPGGTKKQYEASVAAVHPGKNLLPKGQLIHCAGPSKGGWTILAVHDSKASWVSFRDKILIPTLAKGVKGGFTTPPQQTELAVHKLLA